MPVAGQRDPVEVQAVLERWLAEQVGSAVTVTDLVVPQASGFSNETFLFTAQWDDREPQPLVLRSQPQRHALFPEIDLIEQQYTSMKLLREHTDVPVAKVLWAEPGLAELGQPFFVMERLDGLVPGDNPPYTLEGFVVDMDASTRREWHENAVEAMTRVGRVDWRAAGFSHLDKTHHGALGPEQRRGYFTHFLDWATKGERHPVAHPAFERLLAMWPDDGDHAFDRRVIDEVHRRGDRATTRSGDGAHRVVDGAGQWKRRGVGGSSRTDDGTATSREGDRSRRAHAAARARDDRDFAVEVHEAVVDRSGSVCTSIRLSL